jgi:hypothetical protein
MSSFFTPGNSALTAQRPSGRGMGCARLFRVLLPLCVTAVVVTVRHNRTPSSAQGLHGHDWSRSRNHASTCSCQKGR